MPEINEASFTLENEDYFTNYVDQILFFLEYLLGQNDYSQYYFIENNKYLILRNIDMIDLERIVEFLELNNIVCIPALVAMNDMQQ